MSYSIVNVEEIEGAGPGGVVHFVRRELGCEAFGINWFDLPPHAEGFEHDESGTDQEEVNLVVRGDGGYRVAGPNGMTFIGVGARRGSYESHGPF